MTDPAVKVFDDGADGYAKFRPQYTEAFIGAVAAMFPDRKLAVDAGCGSGQATRLLALHFDRVVAIDPAPRAIERAPLIDNVQWAVAPCNVIPVEEGTVNAICAAQAAHWFNMEAFAAECRRAGTLSCRVALFGYDVPLVKDAVDACVRGLYDDLQRTGDWDTRRTHVDSHLQTLPFPFDELPVPAMPPLTLHWPVEGVLGYLRTWSAVRHRSLRTGMDPVDALEPELRRLWGHQTRAIRWPTFIRLGQVHS